jgi:hypothetical protein
MNFVLADIVVTGLSSGRLPVTDCGLLPGANIAALAGDASVCSVDRGARFPRTIAEPSGRWNAWIKPLLFSRCPPTASADPGSERRCAPLAAYGHQGR